MKQFGASTKSFPLLHTNKRQFFQLLFSHIRSFIAQDWIFAPEADEADVYTLKSCKSPRFVEAVTVLLGFCYLPADRGMHLELKMSSWLPPRRVGDSLGIPSFAISQWQKLQRRLVAYLSSGNEGCEREKKSKKKKPQLHFLTRCWNLERRDKVGVLRGRRRPAQLPGEAIRFFEQLGDATLQR